MRGIVLEKYFKRADGLVQISIIFLRIQP